MINMALFDEWHFNRENVVDLNAAVVGIRRNRWRWVPDGTSRETAIQIMREERYDVLPITAANGAVIGYFRTRSWNDYSSITHEAITYKDVLPLQTHIRDLIKDFATKRRFFYFLSN